MDIPRKSAARQRLIKRIIYITLAIILISATTVVLSRLKPAAPTVERATVWIDTVKRGPMLRQVRGLGTLVPEEIRWIPASTEGRVERRLVEPGTAVKPSTVLLELSNPSLDQAALDAEMQAKGAEARLADLRVTLQSQLLTQKAGAAQVEADYKQAQLRADTDAELARQGLTADLNRQLSALAADQLANRNRIEKERLAISGESIKAQIAVQQAEVDRLRALAGLKRQQVDQLHVRAGLDGVLQQVPVEIGQQVTAGTNLARVAEPRKLKAELKIAETQAKDVQVGQLASIDTRNGIISGHVIRIDPAVVAGTVTVDVKLEGALPDGARPDLSVEGTIELERLAEVLYVGRPVQGQAFSTVGLFKLVEDGKEAIRVPVKLGRSSVNTIEIVEGLQVGDSVILSDMSAQDRSDRIRLN
ncbi:MAG: HlyD family efflux transporter periplasmic adaptor subunit [Acidobacteriia bacterium]|nr:HlyD family efflux transporter periplasmic adaptor subunit [Terriglobia bacterium]